MRVLCVCWKKYKIHLYGMATFKKNNTTTWGIENFFEYDKDGNKAGWLGVAEE